MDSIKPIWIDRATDEEEIEILKDFAETMKQLVEDVREETSTVKPQPDLLQLLEIARENNRIRMEMNGE